MAQQTERIGDVNKTMTAIEWLLNEIGQRLDVPIYEGKKIIEQAKQMEKQQIENAFLYGDKNGFGRYKSFTKDDDMTPEQYYKQTFKNQ